MESVAEIAKKKVAIQKAYLVSCVNSRLEDLEAAAEVLRGKKVAAGVKFYLAAASRAVQEEAEKRGVWQTLLDAGAHPLPSGCGPCIGLGTGLLEAGEVGISATNRNFKGRMGSRDAQCYLGSPEVVAASAVAGYICGPADSSAEGSEGRVERRFSAAFKAAPHIQSGLQPAKHFEVFPATSAPTEKVDILPGFPQERARAARLPATGQPEHRRHLWQGLHLSRGHDARDDGAGGHGELRSTVRRTHVMQATWLSVDSTSAPAPVANRR